MEEYKDYEVYANYLEDGIPREEFAGEVSLQSSPLPQNNLEYLEIDGVCYYPQY